MGSMLSGLRDGVLGVVESAGSSTDTVARCCKCSGLVVKSCQLQGLDALSARVVDGTGLFRQSSVVRARQPRARTTHAQEDADIGIARESE